MMVVDRRERDGLSRACGGYAHVATGSLGERRGEVALTESRLALWDPRSQTLVAKDERTIV